MSFSNDMILPCFFALHVLRIQDSFIKVNCLFAEIKTLKDDKTRGASHFKKKISALKKSFDA